MREVSVQQAGEELRQTAQNVLALGKKAGADRVKCVTQAGRENRLVVENGEFSLANSMQSRSLGLAVHKNDRKGSASTNSVDDESTCSAVEKALALASFSLPDSNLVMADPSQTGSPDGLDFLYSSETAGISLDQLGEFMKIALDRFAKEPKFNLDRFELSTHVSYHGMVNSLGVDQHEIQSTLGWSYLGMARSGDQVSGMDYQGGFQFGLKNLMERIESDIDSFLERVVGSLNPIKCPGYKGPILIAPRALNQLLLGPLLYHVSGRSIMDGKSRWDKSVGEKVVSDKFTLDDKPHCSDLIGATAHDGDGLPTANRSIFKGGVLVSHLHDLYSAKKTGADSTSSAGGPFGLFVETGDGGFGDMVAAAPHVLYVTRFSGNVDPLTGDFSGLAKASRLFSDGKDQGGVGETMIAGNVFEMANQILAVGDATENVGGSYVAPPVLVDGITIS